MVRSGNVATGAKDMLDEMGVKWISPDQLPSLDVSALEVSILFETCAGGLTI